MAIEIIGFFLVIYFFIKKNKIYWKNKIKSILYISVIKMGKENFCLIEFIKWVLGQFFIF